MSIPAPKLVASLNSRGYEAYLDKKDILPGEPWQDRLRQLIRGVDSVVFVITPSAIVSPICNWEVDESVVATTLMRAIQGSAADKLAMFQRMRAAGRFANEDPAELPKAEEMLRTFAATEKGSG